MEPSLNNRVYINPNFKKTEIDSLPTMSMKTTHFNRHYVEKLPKLNNTKPIQNILTNRKIYVNPNFINGNNVTQSNQTVSQRYTENNENFNNESNKQLLYKSKYSFVQNIQQGVVNKEQASENNNYAQTSSLQSQSFQNTTKPTQELLLTRSRYCIVRKKKKLSVTVDHKIQNNSQADSSSANYPVPFASLNPLTCFTNLNAIKNNQKNKLISKKPEKIAKIKISKYKTVPVSYLKKNTAVQTNDNKFIASYLRYNLKTNLRSNSSFNTCNRSRFRFIKPSTPIKSVAPISTLKVVSRTIQQAEKGACSGSKVKSSKALRGKFNINNIPCRLFTKYGKCLRKDQGNCKFLHDKKHVSLCRKFLKGICHDKNCSLSHEPTAKKMPTCYFYLKGMCTKDDCPYLHVKLNDKTKICQEFAKGYCESGDQCPYKHVNVDLLRNTKKACSHKRRRPQNNTKSKQINSGGKYQENLNTIMNLGEIKEQDGGDCRYYKESVNSVGSYETIKPKRCKLGTLPSFINL